MVPSLCLSVLLLLGSTSARRHKPADRRGTKKHCNREWAKYASARLRSDHYKYAQSVSTRSSAMQCVIILVLVTLGVCAPTTCVEQTGPLNLAFSKMAVYNEEPCLQAGGMCLEKSECPEGKLTEQKGLCPEQQKRDVECCLDVSTSVKDCAGLGGMCRESCPESIQIKRAEDCGTQICCALVNK